jgi:hypothetical protein
VRRRGKQTLQVSTPVGGWVLAIGESLTLGRGPGADVVLSDDPGMSRCAARVFSDGGLWWVQNTSSHRPLHLVEAGLAKPILPVRTGWTLPTRSPLLTEVSLLLLPGNRSVIQIELRTSLPSDPAAATVIATTGTSTARVQALTSKELVAAVALAWQWLQPYPRYRPEPLTYANAAALLTKLAGGRSFSESTVRRRIEHLRTRLVTTGDIDLPEESKDTRALLCEYLIAAQLITHSDADWLRHQMASDDEDPTAEQLPGK